MPPPPPDWAAHGKECPSLAPAAESRMQIEACSNASVLAFLSESSCPLPIRKALQQIKSFYKDKHKGPMVCIEILRPLCKARNLMSNILHSVLSQRFSIEDLVLVNDEDQTADEMVLILYKRPPFPHSPHIRYISGF